MQNTNFYTENLDSAPGDVIDEFTENLTPTNRSHSFFVDWEKVREQAQEYKYELNLLNSLTDSQKFEKDFKELLQEYPEVVRAFPILIAVRDLSFPVVEDFEEEQRNFQNYNFNTSDRDNLDQGEIQQYYEFVEKTGLQGLFNWVGDLHDYIFGVEAGMDTNARKNRSGDAMERMLEPVVDDLSDELGFEYVTQKSLDYLEKEYDIEVPDSLRNRVCDFLLVKDGNYVNIEVNFFQGSGSKVEEIVNSYINRRNELRKKEGDFIFVTDGPAWETSQNQIKVAFNNLPYLLNIYFIRKGLLKAALEDIFE